jgi:hypothetical protein
MPWGPWPGGGGGGGGGVTLFNGAAGAIKFPLQIDTFFADQMIVPNASWAVPAPALTDQDNTSPVRAIVAYPASPEQGRGVSMFVPVGAAFVRVTRVYKPATAPGTPKVVGAKLYWTTAQDNVAIPAFQSLQLDDAPIAANTRPQFAFEDLVFSDHAGFAGFEEIYFELTRVVPNAGAGSDLVGNANLSMMRFEWYSVAPP